MKLITPPKLIPPLQRTAASGTLPTEQTKLSIAITGPMIGPQIVPSVGLPEMNSACQKLLGTQAARAPAMRKPSRRSWATLATSP